MVVCENKVLLYDLNTRKPYEIARTVLDNKTPTCVCFLFKGGQYAPGGQPDADNLMTSPVLAIGCSDGVVRLLHLATLRVSTEWWASQWWHMAAKFKLTGHITGYMYARPAAAAIVYQASCSCGAYYHHT